MESIPLLAVPVLNRGDLLIRLFDSLNDYPVDKIVIINNGNDDSVYKASETLKSRYGDVLDVIEPIDTEGEFMPYDNLTKRVNWGCSKSWNHILKNYLMANDKCDYAFFAANDVAFQNDNLERIIAWMEKDREEHLGKLGTINYTNVGYGFFFVNKTHIERLGYFDENFYPAYYEDMDYNYRMRLIDELCRNKVINENVSMRNVPEVEMIHGNPDSQVNPDVIIDYESCTIHSNKKIKECNDITFWINLRYYIVKWGGDRNRECWKNPYGEPQNDVNYWKILKDHRKEVDIWNKAIFNYKDN